MLVANFRTFSCWWKANTLMLKTFFLLCFALPFFFFSNHAGARCKFVGSTLWTWRRHLRHKLDATAVFGNQRRKKKRLNYSTSKTLVNDPVVDLGWIRVDWTIALECLINEHVFCIPLAQFECGVCSCRIRRSGGQEESSRRTDGAAYRSG